MELFGLPDARPETAPRAAPKAIDYREANRRAMEMIDAALANGTHTLAPTLHVCDFCREWGEMYHKHLDGKEECERCYKRRTQPASPPPAA